jgi:hypothetical protein
MKDLEKRLRALEAENNPANCLECAIRRLNRELGYIGSDEPCRHPRKDLAGFIVELDAALVGG